MEVTTYQFNSPKIVLLSALDLPPLAMDERASGIFGSGDWQTGSGEEEDGGTRNFRKFKASIGRLFGVVSYSVLGALFHGRLPSSSPSSEVVA